MNHSTRTVLGSGPHAGQSSTVAVLVNLRARKASHRIASLVRTLLPNARLGITRTLEEARQWVEHEMLPNPPALLLSGGGDGTAVCLLNEMMGLGMPLPALGLLPLGTGNGWARVMGAPRAATALRAVASIDQSPLELCSFSLVEADGRVCPFAGAGWDADILHDHALQRAKLPASLRTRTPVGLAYFFSITTRSLPRYLFRPPPRVTVTNLGEDALTADSDGKLVRVPCGGAGQVIYRGPFGVLGAGTTPAIGMGFRAFPILDTHPGRMAVRVYNAPAGEAARNVAKLFRGERTMPGSHEWLLTHCRMDFDRDVPLEVGGDIEGTRRHVEFRLSAQRVNLVDWRPSRSVSW